MGFISQGFSSESLAVEHMNLEIIEDDCISVQVQNWKHETLHSESKL
jgi:hypothetical protein